MPVSGIRLCFHTVEQLNRLASSGLGQRGDGKWAPPSYVAGSSLHNPSPLPGRVPMSPQSLGTSSTQGSVRSAILRSLAGAGVSSRTLARAGARKGFCGIKSAREREQGAWMNSTRHSTHSEMPPGEAMPGSLAPACVVAGPQALGVHRCVQLTLTSHSVHTHLTLCPLSRKGGQTGHNHTPVPGDTRPSPPPEGRGLWCLCLLTEVCHQ